MDGRMNKHKAVLGWLQSHDSISSMEAIEEFGATRLSAIIFDLRKHGHDIQTVMCEGTDRYGNRMRFARYHLRDAEPNGGGSVL